MKCGSSASFSQVTSTVGALQRSEGLEFRKVFSADEISEVMTKARPDFRDRAFSPAVTLFGFMHQALNADKSMRQVITRINCDRLAAGKKSVSTDTGSYSEARHKLPIGPIRHLFYKVAQDLEPLAEEKLGPAKTRYRGRKVKVADGSTLLMPDTPANQAAFPQVKKQAKGAGFPIARIAIIFSLFTGAAYDLAIGPYQGKETGEHALLRQLFHCLDKDDILLGDAYFASYFLMALLQSMGIDFLFENHGARKSDYRTGKRLGKKDHIASIKRPAQPDWMDDTVYALLPDKINVREIQVTLERNGCRAKKLSLITSFTDPKLDAKENLANLYGTRWSAETNLRDIKSTLSMDMLRCKTPEMVKKEIWIHLLAYNAIRKIMLEAAVSKGRLPWEISFKAAIQVFNNYSTLWRDKTLCKKFIYAEIVKAISSQIVGQRPGRSEPRKRKRRPKPFPLLKGERQAKKFGANNPRKEIEYMQKNTIFIEVNQTLRA